MMNRPRGYYTPSAYIGFLPDGSRRRFPTEAEYIEYFLSLSGHTEADS